MAAAIQTQVVGSIPAVSGAIVAPDPQDVTIGAKLDRGIVVAAGTSTFTGQIDAPVVIQGQGSDFIRTTARAVVASHPGRIDPLSKRWLFPAEQL